ncbi:MAG: EamA family transporter, partial [Bacteroidota bacterium]
MQLKHFILGIITTLVWGVNFVSIKMSYDVFTPFWLISARFLLCFFPFIFFVPRPKTSWPQLSKICLFFWLGQFVFTFLGVYKGVPAGLASVLLQSSVILTAVFAWIFLKQKISLKMGLCLGVSFIGILMISANMASANNWIGYLLLMLGATCVAIGNLSLKTKSDENILSLIVWCSFLTFIPASLLAFFLEGTDQIIYILNNLNTKVCGSLIFTAYFSTILANFVWVYLMRHYEATTVSPFTLLVPIFGILSCYVFLGEKLSLHTAIS